MTTAEQGATGETRPPSSGILLRTTGSLVAVSVLNGGIGFVFWWVAAGFFDTRAVGIAATIVSAMTLLGRVSVLGLGMALIGELPLMQRSRSPLIVASLLVSAVAGVLLAGAFALAAPLIVPELDAVSTDVWRVAIFAVGVGLTSAATVLDQVLIGLLRGGLQLVRNVVFSIAKLAALAAAGLWLARDAMTVYGAWAVGTAVSLAFVWSYAWRVGARQVLPLAWRKLVSMARGALAHHALNVSRFAPVSLMPIVVTAMLSASDAAAFFISLMIANYVSVVGQSATLTLYAVGARAPDQLWRHLRLTVAVSIVSALLGSAVLTVAGGPILTIFGPEYAERGFPAIAILTLRAFPLVVKEHWIAVRRVRRRVGLAAALGWATVALELSFAVVGTMIAGLVGLTIAWLAALLIEVIVMGPTVYHAARSDGDGGPGKVDSVAMDVRALGA